MQLVLMFPEPCDTIEKERHFKSCLCICVKQILIKFIKILQIPGSLQSHQYKPTGKLQCSWSTEQNHLFLSAREPSEKWGIKTYIGICSV